MIKRNPYELPVVSARLDMNYVLLSNTIIESVKDAVNFLAKKMYDLASEQAVVLYLDNHLHPICITTIGSGVQNSATISVRDVVQMGLLCNASNIILVHNHPDMNSLKPSEQDILFMEAVRRACDLCNIQLLDSIIISGLQSENGRTPAYYHIGRKRLEKMIKKMNLPETKMAKNEDDFEWEFNGDDFWSFHGRLEGAKTDNTDKYEYIL